MGTVSAIIVAAGSGRRMASSTRKQFLLVAGKPVLYWTLSAFQSCRAIDHIIVVLPAQDEEARELLGASAFGKVYRVVEGGAERVYSVKNGLGALAKETEYVAVHDGVRCLITPDIIERAVASARLSGAAVVAVPVEDTIKVVSDYGMVESTPDRRTLWRVQTPQVFRRDVLTKAYSRFTANPKGDFPTDDSTLVERLGQSVSIVRGSTENLKITMPFDLRVAEQILLSRLPPDGVPDEIREDSL